MATQTLQINRADDGRVVWEADYDDVSLKVLALRVVNGSDQGPDPANCASRVWLVNDPTTMFPVDGSFLVTAPGHTNTANLNAAQQAKFQLVVQQKRSGVMAVANLDGDFEFPAP